MSPAAVDAGATRASPALRAGGHAEGRPADLVDVRPAARHGGLAPLAVLLLGLALTWWAHSTAERMVQEHLAQFEGRVERARAEVQSRFDQMAFVLRGLRGLYEASEEVSNDELRDFAASVGVPQTLPGLRGFGFFERSARADGGERFRVSHEFRVEGAPWLGRNAAADPALRMAIQRAVSSTGPVLAPALGGPEYFYMLPVRHRAGARPAAASGPDGLRGLVYAPILMDAVLAGADHIDGSLLGLRVVGAAADGSTHTLYASRLALAGPGSENGRAEPALQRELKVGDLPMRLLVHGGPDGQGEGRMPSSRAIVVLGAAITLMMAWVVWLQARRAAHSAARSQALAAEVELLATVARRTSNSVMVTDLDHRIRWVNEGFERLRGCSAASRVGSSAMDLAVAGLDASEVERLRQCLSAGQSFQGELRYRLPDGQLRYTAIDIQTLQDQRGRREGYMAMEVDITEIKAALRRWQARAELSGEWFWQTDAQHRFEVLTEGGLLGANRPHMGQRRDEVPGMGPPEGGWAAFHARLDRHEVIKGLRYCTRAGSDDEVWVEIDGRPRWDETGVFVGYEGVGRDISQHLRNAAALRESLALLDAMFDFIPVGAAWKDTQGRYLRANRAFVEYAGRTAEQVLGGTVQGITDPASAELHMAQDREAVREGRVLRYEAQQHLPDGRLLDLLMCKAPVTDSEGRCIGIVVTVMDISDRKASERLMTEAKEMAEAASRAKSSFLAAMSHEIRTPMNGVVGMAELLSRSGLGDEQSIMLQTMIDSSHALLRLIDDILDFSKIEAGRLDLDLDPLHLTPLVEGVCSTLAPLAGTRNVRLIVCMGPELPERLVADATRLRQLLNNLIGNAIKFSAGRPERPGLVTVRVQRDGERLRFSISDNGVGMDAATQARLFQPFAQGSVSTTRRFGGTGLGLAICRRLVDLMKGEIQVHSVPGQGSTFTVALPLELTAEQPVLPVPDLHGLDCVLVEDDTLPNDDLQAWLTHAGARVVRETGLAQGWQAALARPDTVVLIHDQAAEAGYRLPEAPATLRRLVIGRGSRRVPGVVSPTAAELDLIRRLPFLRAVAVAAGRASPELVPLGLRPDLAGGAVGPLVALSTAGQAVLVVEDDPINRAVISRQLALLGCAADMAENGTVALQMWRRRRYGLLLTDLHMPEMDGYELTRAIRREEAACGSERLPILALTANALRGESHRARAVGVDDYLTKPLPLAQLHAALLRWLPRAVADAGTAAHAGAGAGAGATAAVAAAAGLAVFDRDVLHGMVGDDPQTVRAVLQDFLEAAQDQAAGLRQALRAGDPAQAGALAHRLKSSSRAVGALALGELCATIDRPGEDGGQSVVGHLLPAFDRAFDAAQASISRFLEEVSP